jgi:hypothetical protein
VQHKPEVAFHADRDSLADTAQLADDSPFRIGQRRLHRSEKERTRQAHPLDRQADDAWPKGRDVCGDIRQLWHAIRLQLPEAEAGRLQMPVHIHTGAGCGGYFSLRDAEPLLLESVLNDARLRKTNFVLLHGGSGPFTRELTNLLMKPNVYTDLSEQTWMLSPRALAAVVRDWLEAFPEKVLFGTDLFPGDGAYDWEEIGWQTAETGRTALGIALTGMMQDGEITRARAIEIARLVLRGNALKLYGWSERP